MDRLLGRFTEQTYALMRIVTGFLFACHGAQKLFGVLGGQKVELGSLMGLAGIIEFFGGILIAIGLVAGVAAFIASGQMAVAYFMAHAPQGTPLSPLQNGGELPVLYAFVFLYVAAKGNGIWSVGSAFGGRR